MKKLILVVFILSLISSVTLASPKITFHELMYNAEQNNSLRKEAHQLANQQSLPVTILTQDGTVIDAKGTESGKVVYAVIKDQRDIFKRSVAAFYDEIISTIDISDSKLIYADGSVVDNSNGKFNFEISGRSGVEEYLMIPDWTFDRVYLFSKANGDLVDTAFIPYSPTVFASPKMAMQHFNGRSILVSDQITDGVFRFDTSGTYIGLFAPSGGINTSILDNIRGIMYRPNRDLLVCVASGASQNTIQQFDTSGNHIGTFIGNSNLNSPFSILIRSNDILISNSSGTNRITRFDLNGIFLSNFYTGAAFTFPQQLNRLPNGNILVAGFSSPSGIVILDSNGVYMRLINSITGARGVYLLDNGRYIATSSTGVYEIDSTSGIVTRTLAIGANFQYISLYNPGLLVSSGNNSSYIADNFKLEQNYPNPFNPNTIISYQLGNSDNVTLKVYDVKGNEVATLVNEKQSPGSYQAEFNGKDLSSGVYYYEIKIGEFAQTKKMMLVK